MFEFLKKKIGAMFKKEEPKKKTKKNKVKKQSAQKKKIEEEPKKSKKTKKIEKKQIQIEEKTETEEAKLEENLEKTSFFEKAKDFFSSKKEAEKKKIEEEPKEEGFFSKLVKKITSGKKLEQEQFDEIFSEFEITLLENNVALEAVDKIKDSLAKEIVGQEIKASEAEQKVLEALKNSILSLLIEPPDFIEQIKKKAGIFTILFFGINGTGKTTSIAKIAHLLKKNNISCVLAAADTFRAASIEQLKAHAEKLRVPIISSQYGSDPASVAFEAKKYAQSHNIKVVLIDTAGRMYTKDNLLKEMEKIVRISQPDLKIFVGESITGNDAIDQARTFNETAGIDGIILSKADIDEKAGTILSVSHITNRPIYFLGTGQDYKDLAVFSKKTVLKNLGLEE